MDRINEFLAWLAATQLLAFVQAFVILVAGFFIARLVSATVTKIFKDRLTAHSAVMLKRGLFYFILVLFLMSALRELGFDLSVIIGAAGIFSVAIGFASQTSASNLISGLFIMIERPFSIKDVIRVGTTTGEVISIDLLSVKLRTPDNLFVRIPNETMIKTEVTTMTKFPIRRMDILVGVAYKEDLKRVKELLNLVASKNNLCLEEPAPLFIIQAFGTSSIDLQFSVWAKRENFLKVKNEMYEQIKQTFDEQGIEIPFPHVSLYAGSASEPIRFQQESLKIKPDVNDDNN